MYDDQSPEHQRVLSYCATCPRMCRFACPVAHVEARETVTPWGLVSLLHLHAQGAASLDDAMAQALSRCTGCLRCQTACLHDNHVPRAVFEGRRRARADQMVQLADHGAPRDDAPLDGPSLGFAAASDVAFWSSCHDRTEDRAELRRVARLLDVFGARVELIDARALTCCGYPLLARGDAERYQALARSLAERFAAREKVLTDCDGLLALLRTPGWQDPWLEAGLDPGKVQHWSEALADKLGGVDLLDVNLTTERRAIVYHDACRLGRGAGVYDAPRTLLRWAFGPSALLELDDHREWALCCGQGADYPASAPAFADALAHDLTRDARRRGVDATLVSASPGCSAHMRAAAARAAERDDATVEVRALSEVLTQALGLIA